MSEETTVLTGSCYQRLLWISSKESVSAEDLGREFELSRASAQDWLDYQVERGLLYKERILRSVRYRIAINITL